MIRTAITRCRVCQSPSLDSILNLGTQALTGVFPRSPYEQIPSGPLELVRCDPQVGCGLVQLRHSYPPGSMYGDNYGYRSGLNRSMVAHLQRRVRELVEFTQPKSGDLILDIGSNDATTLKAYPQPNLDLVGIDPTGAKFSRFYPPHVRLIPDSFDGALIAGLYPKRKARIITSFAMFYDLEDPLDFMRQVRELLADDGVWAFEQSYLPSMLKQLAYDTVCHEHLSYYALRQIKWMTDGAGLKIVRVETNEVNGGSFCVTVAKSESTYPEATEAVGQMLAREAADGIDERQTYERFAIRVDRHGEQLRQAVRRYRQAGRTICGYGASTKGNVLLQYCGLGPDDLPAIAEVNEDKFGSFTPGTHIPIRSEAEVHAMRPDALLVMPWHFRTGIVDRERAYLERGGKLVFPLPMIEVHQLKRAVRKPQLAKQR